VSAWATVWAYEQDIRPCGKKAVLVALAHFADESGFCYPSQETLAGMTSQGVSTVRSHLEVLESGDEPLIKREHRYTKKGKRTSDGFYLQAPAERLQPPKHYRRKLAVETQDTTAKKQADYRQVSAPLPPKAGDDLLEEQSEKKEMTAYAVLFDRHYRRIGDVPDGKAQGDAINWILARHSTEKALACYEFQLAEPWRNGHVSWLTVKQRIGEFELTSNGKVGPPVHDAAFHARQAELARRLGREYRPDAS